MRKATSGPVSSGTVSSGTDSPRKWGQEQPPPHGRADTLKTEMLDRKTILDRLAANAGELHAMGARSVALFGSFARDEAGSDSDVDLLVDLDEHTFDRYMDLKLHLEDLLERRVDLVLVDGLKPRVRDKILSEAIRAA